MHNATRNIATVARTYASHVPLPARAHTSGMVAAGVVVGAMVETDCARVSMGERIPCRKPSVPGPGAGSVGSIECASPFLSSCDWGGLYNTCRETHPRRRAW